MSEKHVAVLAFPFATHATLLFGLLCRLAAAAPTVTFSFYSTAKSNCSLFSTNFPANVRPLDVPDGLPDGFVPSGNPLEEVDLFLEVAEEGFRAAMLAAEAETGRQSGCVVADAFLWFAAGLAENAGTKWVPVWTSGACSLATHFYTDLIRETVGNVDISSRENEILKFIPGFPELRMGDIPNGVLFGDRQSPFPIMLHKMGQVLQKATALPLNSYEGLELDLNKDLASKFQNFLNIGPFNLTSPPQSPDDPYQCIPWLDKHLSRTVAYIGFGTVVIPPPHELAALAGALETRGTPFLWSLKEKGKENLPDGFLDRTREIGMIIPWVPQVRVLEHRSIGVFVSHFGWNSVLEGIVAGMPMIGRPFFGDHQMNAWMVENVWKIGVRVEGGTFTKNGMMAALEVVFNSEKGKKLKEQSEKYKEIALEAVGPQGSSTRNFNTLVGIITAWYQSLKVEHPHEGIRSRNQKSSQRSQSQKSKPEITKVRASPMHKSRRQKIMNIRASPSQKITKATKVRSSSRRSRRSKVQARDHELRASPSHTNVRALPSQKITKFKLKITKVKSPSQRSRRSELCQGIDHEGRRSITLELRQVRDHKNHECHAPDSEEPEL